MSPFEDFIAAFKARRPDLFPGERSAGSWAVGHSPANPVNAVAPPVAKGSDFPGFGYQEPPRPDPAPGAPVSGGLAVGPDRMSQAAGDDWDEVDEAPDGCEVME